MTNRLSLPRKIESLAMALREQLSEDEMSALCDALELEPTEPEQLGETILFRLKSYTDYLTFMRYLDEGMQGWHGWDSIWASDATEHGRWIADNYDGPDCLRVINAINQRLYERQQPVDVLAKRLAQAIGGQR